jgi:hypothetical protein
MKKFSFSLYYFVLKWADQSEVIFEGSPIDALPQEN